MNFERYSHDLEANLRIQAELAFCRTAGFPMAPEAAARARERLTDLVADASLGALQEMAAGGSSHARSLLRPLQRLAIGVRTAAVREELEARLAADLGAECEPGDWYRAEVRLAAIDALRPLERERRRLERAAAVWNEFFTELGDARAVARQALPAIADAEEAARRQPLRLRRHEAERLLEIGAAGHRELLDRLQGRLIPEHGPEPHWSALPRLLGGESVAGDLPAPDQRLLDYTLTGLGLQGAAGRLLVDTSARPGKMTAAHWHAVIPGSDVRGTWCPLGRLRDYRGILRVLGGCLPLALAEPEDPLSARVAAPGVAMAWAGVFAALTRNADWIERTFQRPCASAQAHWRLQQSIRIRQLAVGAAHGRMHHDPELPMAMPADRLTAATGFRHPDLLLPWSDSPERIDTELRGEAAAAALYDMLATRFGSDWWRRAACGRLLRDLWAAAHPSLTELCHDLSVKPIGLADLAWWVAPT